jgi:hypothetical protein
VTTEQVNHPEHKIAGAPISWGVSEVPGWASNLVLIGCSERCVRLAYWRPRSDPRASCRASRLRWSSVGRILPSWHDKLQSGSHICT